MTDRDREKAHALLKVILSGYDESEGSDVISIIAQAITDERAETWRAARDKAALHAKHATDGRKTMAEFLADEFEARAKETTR